MEFVFLDYGIRVWWGEVLLFLMEKRYLIGRKQGFSTERKGKRVAC